MPVVVAGAASAPASGSRSLESVLETIRKSLIVDRAYAPGAEAQWRQFWEEVDRIGVWQWSPRYWSDDALDGTQWSLELRYGEREVKSEGSNLYPSSTGTEYSAGSPLADFLRALAKLTGQPDIAPEPSLKTDPLPWPWTLPPGFPHPFNHSRKPGTCSPLSS